MNELRKAESELDEGLRLGALLWPRKMATELRRLHEENEALRQALAQPEQDLVAKYTGKVYRCHMVNLYQDIPDEGCLVCARKKQEPVAWLNITDEGERYIQFAGSIKDFHEGTKFYTAPPKRKWKGLTSDDKHFLLANAWNKEQAFDGFMEAIDKFLEEKNT